MADDDLRPLAFESFGVRVAVGADDPLVLQQLRGLDPVPSQACDAGDVDHRISVEQTNEGFFNVKFLRREGEDVDPRDPTSWIAGDADLDLAIATLDAHVQSLIALHSTEHVFVRAGAVAYNGHAIVLPGDALTGKSTLVRALVNAGAVEYSEDFAPIDGEGRVHPYRRLAFPGPHQLNGSADASPRSEQIELPGPLPVSAFVLTTYRPDAEWNPTRLSGGEAMLAVIAHTESTGERPTHAMPGVRHAFESHPVALRSDRGEANVVAPRLLADVEQALRGAD